MDSLAAFLIGWVRLRFYCEAILHEAFCFDRTVLLCPFCYFNEPIPINGVARRPSTSLRMSGLSEDWSWQQDLNPRPTDYKSVALPTELCQRLNFFARSLRFFPSNSSAWYEIFRKTDYRCAVRDDKLRKRETGLEPATYSLEGCRSTNWAIPAP